MKELKVGYYVEIEEFACPINHNIEKVVNIDNEVASIYFEGFYGGHSCNGVLEGKDSESGLLVPLKYLKPTNLR